VAGSLSGTVTGYQEVCQEMWPGSRKSAGIVAREQDDCQGQWLVNTVGSLLGTVAGYQEVCQVLWLVIRSLSGIIAGL
jgi:hypothetical protein